MIRLILQILEAIVEYIVRVPKKLIDFIKNSCKTPDNIPPGPVIPPLEKKKYFHLSILENYLKRYNLSKYDEDSFFQLRGLIINDGKKIAIDRIKSILAESNNKNLIEKATKLIEAYNSLQKENFKLDIKEAPEDTETPKIYIFALDKYLKEFGLEKEADSDLKNTVFKVMDLLYDNGKNQVLELLASNIEWLEKYISSNDEGRLKEELDRIIKKISSQS